MSSKNPFAVLGFARDAFKGLKDDEAATLVRFQYRQLAAIFHTDGSRPNQKRFRAIQDAWEFVDFTSRPESFRQYRIAFEKTRKNAIADLEATLEHSANLLRATEESALRFWEAFAVPQKLPSVKYGYVHSVFDIPACRVIVHNELKTVLVSQAADRPFFPGETSDMPGRNFDLEIGPDGSLTLYPIKKVVFHSGKENAPDLPPGWVQISNQPAKSYYWGRDGDESYDLSGVHIIGSYLVKTLSENDELRRSQKLLSQDVGAGDFEALEQGFEWSSFSAYVRAMLPLMISDATLVGVVRRDDKSLFKVIGRLGRAIHYT